MHVYKWSMQGASPGYVDIFIMGMVIYYVWISVHHTMYVVKSHLYNLVRANPIKKENRFSRYKYPFEICCCNVENPLCLNC